MSTWLEDPPSPAPPPEPTPPPRKKPVGGEAAMSTEMAYTEGEADASPEPDRG